jgi:hypothetical protein
LRELRVVWLAVAAAAAAVFVTYWRLPAAETYNVSSSGPRGGASRMLVDLNFPDALIALAVLGVMAPFLSQRLRAVAAAAALLSWWSFREWSSRAISTRAGSTSCRRSVSCSRSR